MRGRWCASRSRQWVIEDRFPQGRPAWERTGAELVGDVRPYEDMKLRLLNGSHSSIAYLGQLAGWQTVADAIAEPELRAHIAALMSEVATTLTLPRDGRSRRLSRCVADPVRQSGAAASHRADRDGRLAETAAAAVRAGAGAACGRDSARRASRWASRPGCASCKGAPTTARRCTLDDPQAERLRAAARSAGSALRCAMRCSPWPTSCRRRWRPIPRRGAGGVEQPRDAGRQTDTDGIGMNVHTKEETATMFH